MYSITEEIWTDYNACCQEIGIRFDIKAKIKDEKNRLVAVAYLTDNRDYDSGEYTAFCMFGEWIVINEKFRYHGLFRGILIALTHKYGRIAFESRPFNFPMYKHLGAKYEGFNGCTYNYQFSIEETMLRKEEN